MRRRVVIVGQRHCSARFILKRSAAPGVGRVGRVYTETALRLLTSPRARATKDRAGRTLAYRHAPFTPDPASDRYSALHQQHAEIRLCKCPSRPAPSMALARARIRTKLF